METTHKESVEYFTEIYLCPGCMHGPDTKECPNFKSSEKGDTYGPVCLNHIAGTSLVNAHGVERIMLGFPKGFCKNFNQGSTFEKIKRDDTEYLFHEEFPEKEFKGIFNIPVWKHLDEHGNTLVKVLSPRINKVGISIYRGNHLNKINCMEITKEQCEDMD